MIEVGTTYVKQGWRIVVYEICNDQVYFQGWPPGIEEQSYLGQMPIALFEQVIAGVKTEKEYATGSAATIPPALERLRRREHERWDGVPEHDALCEIQHGRMSCSCILRCKPNEEL